MKNIPTLKGTRSGPTFSFSYAQIRGLSYITNVPSHIGFTSGAITFGIGVR